jgi:hypothetical protein
MLSKRRVSETNLTEAANELLNDIISNLSGDESSMKGLKLTFYNC